MIFSINVNYFLCGTYNGIMDLFLNALGLATTKTYDQRKKDLIPHNLRELSDQELRQVCDFTTVDQTVAPGFISPPHNLIPYDAIRALHRTFCSETCQLDAQCKNGGMTWHKPEHCNECICPHGLTGSHCTEVIKHNNPSSKWCKSQITEVKEGQSISFRTGHRVGYSFPLPQDCTWLFKAPPRRKITFLLVGETFGYNCTRTCVCRDYLDINTGNDLSVNEYRLCCNRPLGKRRIVSQTNQMLIMSRVHHTGSNGFLGMIYLASRADRSGFYTINNWNP